MPEGAEHVDDRDAYVVLTARTEVIQKNRAAMLDFFEDFIRATRWYMDPANHEKAVDIVARYTKVPAPQLQWIFTKEDFYRDPGATPDIGAIQRSVDMLKEFGFVKGDLEVKKFADLSLIEEAAGRIK